MQVYSLRCEYLKNPLGIDVLKPRLSWKLSSDSRGERQTAYRLIVATTKERIQNDNPDLWDSKIVNSSKSNHIVYKGKSLKSQMFCYWKVKVWGKSQKASSWSKIAFWSMGLLNTDDWHADWIGELHKDRPWLLKRRRKKKSTSCPLLRKEFSVNGTIKRAFIYVTGLGEYILKINGKRVGDHIFPPEWTNYYKRIQYQTYDISALLKDGENAIGAILGDGWYAGHIGPGYYYHSHYGLTRLLIAQIVINYLDGRKQIIKTDSSWKIFRNGPIRQSDHFQGEIFDCRKEERGWDLPNYDDSHWHNVFIENVSKTLLVAQMNEPIRIIKEIEPVEISNPKEGIYIYDLGQNISGWCKIKVSPQNVDPNSTITLKHGEMLKEDGTLYTKNLRTAKSTDKYILDDKILTRKLKPHFTYHGFRYVKVSGLKKGIKPKLEMIKGCVISSDIPISGYFESSNEKLNKLWNNVLWTQRDNLISIPTDCPQRDERMGWLGDALVFAQTSIFNMDMAAFYSKWIKDLKDAQCENGVYPKFAPYPFKRSHKFPFYKLVATPGWSDCGIILPWTIFLNYRDKRIIQNHYDSAKKYVDYVLEKNPSLIWKYCPFSYIGDWLNGDHINITNYPETGAKIPRYLFSTAFLAHTVKILSKMANLLKKERDSVYYSDLYRQIKQKINQKFIDKKGQIKGGSQGAYALILDLDLVENDIRSKLIKNLQNTIEAYDKRLSTGFCTTHRMMLSLAQNGLAELAYDLLFTERIPSWFYMINQGATTMWERWDGYVEGRGFQLKSMNSFNHYSFGAIGEFIYKMILGINYDPANPGYKDIIIRPKFDKRLSWVKGYYESIYGPIEVSWIYKKERIEISISVPVNTTAKFQVETKFEVKMDPSDHRDLKIIKENENLISISLESGNYIFVLEKNKM